MANNTAGGKRKRQQSHSEQDKFVHKSGVLLQREAKKVRIFLVRKVVQQLKQTRAQLEAAQREHDELLKQTTTSTPDGDDALVKKDKQLKKLQTAVHKLEKELVVFKALDLKAVVARAMTKTGLEKKKQEEQQKKLLQQQQLEMQMQQQSRYGGDMDSDGDESNDGGRERQLADESSSDEDDDGFDSEEYEKNARNAGGGESESDDEQEAGDAEPAHEEAEPMEQLEESTGVQEEGPVEKPSTESVSVEISAVADEQEVKPAAEPVGEQETKPIEEAKTQQQQQQQKDADLNLQNALIDRILAHKQMTPLLAAIEKVLEKDERETEKKLRQQEKKALKRDRNEGVLIGGRSSAAPTSLFLGSLSGRGGALDDDADLDFGMSSSYMDGAEDDIAEFLGEKKKKNRMGQNARRQKAIRVEESTKRKQDRENGIFRPFGPRKDDTVSKYGPSERPKKKKPVAEVPAKGKSRGGKPSRDGKPGRDAKPERGGRGERGGNGRERERGAPAPVSASSRPTPFNAPPKVDVSHPSWIAKQALKEKEKASITAFSGKKITFGDD